MKLLKNLFKLALTIAVGVIACVVLTQDLRILPGVHQALFIPKGVRDPNTLPKGVESIFIETPDGAKLEVWRYPAQGVPKPFVAIICHGNADSLPSFFLFQEWFASLGIVSYGFDYRGFGLSSGWPSERGLEQDSETVWNYALKRENVQPSQMVVLGYSLGTSLASYLGAKYSPHTVVLLSPFTRMKELVGRIEGYRLLTPFLWYDLPTVEYVARFGASNLLIAHGARDELIPVEMGETILRTYSGKGLSRFVGSEHADHGNIFGTTKVELTSALEEFLSVQVERRD